MTNWQKTVIKQFEDMSGWEFIGKKEIKNNKDFWTKWDWNIGWLENVFADVEKIISPYLGLRSL